MTSGNYKQEVVHRIVLQRLCVTLHYLNHDASEAGSLACFDEQGSDVQKCTIPPEHKYIFHNTLSTEELRTKVHEQLKTLFAFRDNKFDKLVVLVAADEAQFFDDLIIPVPGKDLVGGARLVLRVLREEQVAVYHALEGAIVSSSGTNE